MSPPTLPPSAFRPPPADAPPADLSTREAFDGFVAGTFYRRMLSQMRGGQGETAYFGDSRASKVFRERLDGEIADRLAESDGGALTADLYAAFTNQTGVK